MYEEMFVLMLMFISMGVVAQNLIKYSVNYSVQENCSVIKSLLQLISGKKQAFGLDHLISIWLMITESD